MFCMNCGSKLEEGSKFCDICGANVGLGEGDRIKAKVENNRDEQKEPKKVPWGILITVAVVVGVIAILLNTHTCTWCNRTYVGPQYYDVWDSSELMCEKCAQEYYMGFPYENYRK